MKFNVISIFPEMFVPFQKYGVIGRAYQNKIFDINIINPRDFDSSIDDTSYGGGGMVMKYHPLQSSLLSISQEDRYPVIYMTPQGKPINQSCINLLSKHQHITVLCGRYEGIDERFIEDYVDIELSIGDFVISGGELACQVLIDGIMRQIDDVIGNINSVKAESFMHNLLDYPHYTRPRIIDNKSVPSILLSGNHAEISKWRREEQLKRTHQRRPDMLKNYNLTANEQMILSKVI